MSNYSRGDYADLPSDATDLENNYTAPDLTAIASNDNSTYADQTANNEIAIHQYKKTVTSQYTNILWSGKSSLAPSESPVVLEVYNVTGTPAWEELDRDDSTAADTDFDLSYDNLATADYLDSGVITWRVWQAASGAPAITYLLSDTFTTARAAGEVNGTASEPGPGGNRNCTDSVSDISGSKLYLRTPDSGTYFLAYDSISRQLGNTLVAELSIVAGFEITCVGYRTVVGGGGDIELFRGHPDHTDLNIGGTTFVVQADPLIGTGNIIAMVQRAAGHFWFVKVAGGSNFNLLYITDVGISTALYPLYQHNQGNNTSDVNSSDYIRLAEAYWWPTPLVSDAFSGTWPTTDGLGHQGASNTGEGTHGDGVTWTNRVGTFGITSGKAQPSSATAIATAPVGNANVVAVAKLYRPTTGSVGLVLRYADTSNYLIAYHDGTTCKLDKVVGGSPTNLIAGGSEDPYSAGGEIQVHLMGNDIRLYYRNTLSGSVTDSAGATNTVHGIYSTDTGNSIDDISFYAQGSGGEYNSSLEAV